VDLFSVDLEKITLADVENFLALGSPVEGRPSEGIKIDYKGKVPDDLCDTVAAFANTAGGLIFLGVESQKRKNNIPTQIVGVTFAGGDVRAALTGKITSQVLPRPDVDIGVFGLPSGAVVVVLRVREGTYPPYQFTHGEKIRFPIRVQDTNKMCSLRDLEQMFEKRRTADETPEMRIQQAFAAPLFPAYVESVPNSPESRVSGSYHSWAVRPRVRLRIRLERSFETAFQKLIQDAFPDPTLGNFWPPLLNGRSHIVRWQSRIDMAGRGRLTMVRYFECASDGSLRFSERIDRHENEAGESVCDLIIAGLRFLNLTEALYRSCSYFGSLSVMHTLQCQPGIKFLSKFPDDQGRYQTSNAIVFPNQPPSQVPNNSNVVDEIENLESMNRVDFVSGCMLSQLRELRFASVDYQALTAIVAKLPLNVLPFF
jgi:hypothetical protein